MAGPERLEGRDGQVWRAYILGRTQEAIAAEHGISQQRVSQILSEIRSSIPATDRADAALVDLERIDMLLSGVMPAAVAGDTQAARAVLAILERRARMLRLDLEEPLRITLARHLDDQGELLADTIGAVLDALDLSHEQRMHALATAQAKLLGEPLPEVPAPVVEESEKPDLLEDFRRFAAENGFDPDEDDGQEDDGDDE